MKPDFDPQQHIAHATRKAFVEGVLASRGRAEVLGLVGASGAYLLAGLLAASSETLLVVTATQREAARLAADLAFCHGRGGEIFLFPHWEVGPYEPLQPHPEVEAERLAALAALHEGRARALVVPVRALLQRVIPREVLAGLCERLQVEEEYPRPPLLQRLVELGYQAVPLVEDRGTFSVRGDLLDIFPPTRATPVRIEFFGDYHRAHAPLRSGQPALQRPGAGGADAPPRPRAGPRRRAPGDLFPQAQGALRSPRPAAQRARGSARGSPRGNPRPGAVVSPPLQLRAARCAAGLCPAGPLGGDRSPGSGPGGGPLFRRGPRRRGPRRPARRALCRSRRALP